MIIIHKGHPVQITCEPGVDKFKAVDTSMFRSWLDSLDMKNFVVTSVHLQSHDSVDIKGKTRDLFVKFKADVKANGKSVPGIVFASDGAVALLYVLKCGKKRHAIIIRQARTPTGDVAFAEIVAGVIDPDGNFATNMAREIKEELGIDVAAADLKDLSALANHHIGFFVSPGRCSETIRLFYFEQEVTPEFIKQVRGRQTGLAAEHEFITVDVVPLDDLFKLPDGKTQVALGLYKRFVCGRRSRKAGKSA